MKGIHLDLRVVTLCLPLLVNTVCLRCWHCIADDCAKDPSENNQASEKLCRDGQSCQKVYFEMVEETNKGDVIHKSTVLGCSTNCIERNDFLNCTEQLRTSRGCVRKDCCSDGDLCNSSRDMCKSTLSLVYAVISSLSLFKTFL